MIGSFSESFAMPEQDLAGSGGALPAGCRLVPVALSNSSNSWALQGAGAMTTAPVGTMPAGAGGVASMGPVYVRAGSSSSNVGLAGQGGLAAGAAGLAAAVAARRGLVQPPIARVVGVQGAPQQVTAVTNDLYLPDL